MSNMKGKMRIEAPPTFFNVADLPHPFVATMGTSTIMPLDIGQLKLEGLERYFGGKKPSVQAWLVNLE